jgi:hypothetical protein
MGSKNRKTSKARIARSASAPRIISHRANSKAAKAHLFVREHRLEPAAEVIPEMKKKFKLTESSARNWWQTFKRQPMDIRPIGAPRGS